MNDLVRVLAIELNQKLGFQNEEEKCSIVCFTVTIEKRREEKRGVSESQ
jgi:hypothetical protein